MRENEEIDTILGKVFHSNIFNRYPRIENSPIGFNKLTEKVEFIQQSVDLSDYIYVDLILFTVRPKVLPGMFIINQHDNFEELTEKTAFYYNVLSQVFKNTIIVKGFDGERFSLKNNIAPIVIASTHDNLNGNIKKGYTVPVVPIDFIETTFNMAEGIPEFHEHELILKDLSTIKTSSELLNEELNNINIEDSDAFNKKIVKMEQQDKVLDILKNFIEQMPIDRQKFFLPDIEEFVYSRF